MLTKTKLRRFMSIRNRSSFSSNLQFQIDAGAAKIDLDDIGPTRRLTIDGFTGWEWFPKTATGEVRMIEFGGRLYLEGDKDEDSVRMFKLAERAIMTEASNHVPTAEEQKTFTKKTGRIDMSGLTGL